MALTGFNVIGQSSGTNHGTGVYTTSSFTPLDKQLIIAGVFADESAANGGDFTSDLTISDSIGLTWTSRGRVNVPGWTGGIRVWTAQVQRGQSMTLSFDCGARNIYLYRTQVYGIIGHDESSPVGGVGTQTDADGDGPMSFTLDQSSRGDSRLLSFAMTHIDSGASAGFIQPAGDWNNTASGTIDDWFHYALSIKVSNQDSNSVDYTDMCTGSLPLGAGAVALEIRERRQGDAPVAFLRP